MEAIDLQSNSSDIGCGSMREPAVQRENQSLKVGLMLVGMGDEEGGVPPGEQVTKVAVAE